MGLHPKPALLFFIAKKVSKKASPLGTYKTYFEPGVLQLPTVKQIKRLYNSVQNRFYKQVQKGAFNGKQQRQKQRGKSIKKAKNTHCLIGWLGGGAPCGIFTDVKILRAGPRGFCLARKVYPFLRAQTKTSLRPKLKTPHKAGFSNLRSAGVEPTFPASEADALSIELRAR